MNKIVQEILGIEETFGYKSYWLSPDGKTLEGWTHVAAADKFLKEHGIDTSNMTPVEITVEMYKLGWARYTVEHDRISYDLPGGLNTVQHGILKGLSAEKKIPAFDDNGKLLR